jgi:copper/silver-translocating P-type ATPase
MWCTSCARAVESALGRSDGVRAAQVNFLTGAAVIEVDRRLDEHTLRSRIEALGYPARAWSEPAGLQDHMTSIRTDLSVRLALSALCGMWVMLLQLVLYFGDPEPAAATLVARAAGALSTPIVFVGGWRFHRAAWRTLRAGAPGMDFLVSLGSLTAWSLSMGLLLAGRVEVWFDTASMIVTFLLLGRLLEAHVRAKGLSRVRSLLEGGEDLARRNHERVAAEAIRSGDHIDVAAGDRLVADGIVTEGSGWLDTSVLTGEERPTEVGSGDRVEAGTRLVQGRLRLQVTHEVGARRIDEIERSVHAALDQRTDLDATAQRFAERLVPIVLGLAILTVAASLFWLPWPEAVLRGVAVLLVSCPCALGLATPIALARAVDAAIRRGIVLRTPDVVQRATAIDTVVFDKTGTLTESRPRVELAALAAGETAERVWSLAASAEWGVEHPLAGAVREAARSAGAPIESEGERRVVRGRGVLWRSPDGSEVWVGSHGSKHGDPVVMTDGSVRARLRVVTPMKADSRSAVEGLWRAGLDVRVWSGDAEDRVEELMHVLGRPGDGRGRLSPEDKLEALRERQSAGRKVAFVGDGVNDAPVLAAADLGIAVEGAARPAAAVAPILLMRGGAGQVAWVLRLCRRTLRVMHQNLGWAVGYNALAVPLAALGLLTPVGAATAMLASSLSVTVNALRIAE